MVNKVKYAVAASGNGTVFQSIIDAQAKGKIPDGEIVALISNKADAGAIDRARSADIPAHFVDHSVPQDQIDAEIIDIIKTSGAQFLFLAGYLKKITPAILATLPVYNIHPAHDLNRFGGKGMYGIHVHQAVIDAKVETTGATIHEVNENYDDGAILMQSSKVKVLPDDTAESLQQRVMKQEYKLATECIAHLCVLATVTIETNDNKEEPIYRKEDLFGEGDLVPQPTEELTEPQEQNGTPQPKSEEPVDITQDIKNIFGGTETAQESQPSEEHVFASKAKQPLQEEPDQQIDTTHDTQEETTNEVAEEQPGPEQEHIDITQDIKNIFTKPEPKPIPPALETQAPDITKWAPPPPPDDYKPMSFQDVLRAYQEQMRMDEVFTQNTQIPKGHALAQKSSTNILFETHEAEKTTQPLPEEPITELESTQDSDEEPEIPEQESHEDFCNTQPEEQPQYKGGTAKNMKKIVIVGGGGREHAIANQIHRDAPEAKIIAIPGNAGIAQIPNALCIPLAATDVKAITDYCVTENPCLVFVASDDPLALGLVDMLTEKGIRAFGATQRAAEIEWSKSFSKGFMKRHNIPTASYRVFDNCEDAITFTRDVAPHPLVIKANGLALGKGVVISRNIDESKSAILSIMQDKKFGASGETIIIEEFLTGPEITLLAFVDGENYSLMPTSQDHKRAYDGDLGPNTGGMGAYSPAGAWSDEIESEVIQKVVEPTIKGLAKEGRPFKGILYFGIMVTPYGVKVIEYNARFGDPECQTILPLLETNFIDIINACIDGQLNQIQVKWKNQVALCVVIASGGYPGDIKKGLPIIIEDDLVPSVTLIHCGTKQTPEGLVTNGGRVFCLTTTTYTMKQARGMVYKQIQKIKFDGAMYRTDIGKK